MRLLLLRHAKSEKAEPSVNDRDRSLNPRGRVDAVRIGAYMAHHGLLPGAALVSPARRTRETFERVAEAWAAPCPVRYVDRLYNAGPDAIVAAIKEASALTLLVIGHNPGLHEAARLLIASGDVEARERLNEALPTSGLAAVDFPGQDWRKLHLRSGRLERFVTPRLLKAAAD
ncbi:MAG TPA: histidine phosphatase family protein [Xanthobacteraceae bacterium]|jgi:phosphohistidine phosphatase